jgi:glycosyltransferase involved in cell wall biosynthesis
MSEQEGLPMAIVEALSVGLPVLATPVGGVPEAITTGRNGILVARSAQALADALGKLVNDPLQLDMLSRGARSEFNSRFEISQVVASYNAIYSRDA